VILVRKNAIHELADAFSRFHQFPQLETLDLTFNPTYDHSCVDSDDKGRVALQMSILFALIISFAFRAPPKLTSLSLRNLRVWRLSLLDSHPFRAFFTTLRRLHLSVLSDAALSMGFTFRWAHFWGNLPLTILAPAQHILAELTLHSEADIDASSGLSFNGLHFPHLCALSLCKFVFEPPTGVEPFILRHAATLAQLELLSCMLSLADGIPSSSTTSETLAWNNIWDCFEAKLTVPVALHVDSPEYHNFPTICYLSELRNEVDATALQRFHTTVTARSEEMRGEA
jgi:hypothetical protein